MRKITSIFKTQDLLRDIKRITNTGSKVLINWSLDTGGKCALILCKTNKHRREFSVWKRFYQTQAQCQKVIQ